MFFSNQWNLIRFGNHHQLFYHKMSTTAQFGSDLRAIFEKCVNSVKPKYLFNSNSINYVKKSNGIEMFNASDQHNQISLELTNKRITVIGFGKGVLGMATHLEHVLGHKRINSGILSIPIGQQDKFKLNPDMKLDQASKIEIYEGGENNLPDQAALDTARLIHKRVKKLDKQDVLFVLITGGGSALLPFPTYPISLVEKTNLIKQLASKGASIEELNAVRIAVSQVKGGKLLKSAKACHKVVNIIISDIINDPLDLIASGPTVLSSSHVNYFKLAKEILTKYGIFNNLPKSILTVLGSRSEPFTASNYESLLIGTNRIAIASGMEKSIEYKFFPIFLSHQIHGDVTEIAEAFINLALQIQKFRLNEINSITFRNELEKLKSILKFHDNFENLLENNIDRHLCLIAGGEPTVIVTGSGLGGRNQQLALQFLLKSVNNNLLHSVQFLSAGTDGIDGPTNAAGAIANPKLFLKNGEDLNEAAKYLANNDSYNFFRTYNDGSEHVITGHTGTNVMDIQILVIPSIID